MGVHRIPPWLLGIGTWCPTPVVVWNSVMEELLVYYECPVCEFDAVVAQCFIPYCPMCCGDGKMTYMRERPLVEAPDKVEGKDERKSS